MNRRSFLQWMAVGLLATPRSLLSATQREQTPEAAAVRAWELMKQEDPDWIINSLDPKELARLRETLWRLVQVACRAGQTPEVLRFFRLRSLHEVRRLDDRAFYAAVWRGIRQQEPGLTEIANNVDFRTVGHIWEGENRAYVLYRLESRQPDYLLPIWPKVVGLERLKDAWAMLPNNQLEGWEQCDPATLDLAAVLDNMRVEVTDVVGHLFLDDCAATVIRSTCQIKPLRLTQVSVLPLRDGDMVALLRSGDKPALLRSLNETYGAET